MGLIRCIGQRFKGMGEGGRNIFLTIKLKKVLFHLNFLGGAAKSKNPKH